MTEVIQPFQQLQKAGVTNSKLLPTATQGWLDLPQPTSPIHDPTVRLATFQFLRRVKFIPMSRTLPALFPLLGTLPIPLRPTHSSGLLANGSPHDRYLLTNPNMPVPPQICSHGSSTGALSTDIITQLLL